MSACRTRNPPNAARNNGHHEHLVCCDPSIHFGIECLKRQCSIRQQHLMIFARIKPWPERALGSLSEAVVLQRSYRVGLWPTG